jgi:hypothetical protein
MPDTPKDIVVQANLTGRIDFGREYHFLATDTHSQALYKLYATSCEIGGLVQAPNGWSIRVYPCYDKGYWEFYWKDSGKGVSRVTRWSQVAEDF